MLVHTKPSMTGSEKKKPDVLEIPVSGSSVEEIFNYASTILGKEVNISDVFSDGDLMDVVGVTTGRVSKVLLRDSEYQFYIENLTEMEEEK